MTSDNRKGAVGLVAVLLGLCVVVFLVGWPSMLGERVAQEMGAAEGSSLATATGWILEGLCLVAIAAIVVAVLQRRQRAAQEAVRRETAAHLGSLVRQEDERIRLLTLLRDRMEVQPAGVASVGVPAKERLLIVLDGVHLVEPRVQVKGSAPVPTFVRSGSLVVTDRAIRHRSDNRSVEWRFDQMLSEDRTTNFVTWGVSDRQAVSGVGGSEALVDAVGCLKLWADALPGAPDDARRCVDSLLGQADGRKEDLQDEVRRLSAPSDPGPGGALGRVPARQLLIGTASAVAAVVALGLVAGATDGDSGAEATASDARDGQPAASYDSGGEGGAADDVALVPPDRASGPASRQPRQHLVTRVVDGDTLELANGETVRIAGIDTPEVGECGFERSSARLEALVAGRRVALGESGEDRDQYDRLLRYVDVGALDAGLRLIREGLAVARYDSRDGYGRHPREAAYVAADRSSPDLRCAPEPRNLVDRSGSCEPGYTPCVPLYPPDVDCGDVDGPIAVAGTDPHGLDGEGDGRACE